MRIDRLEAHDRLLHLKKDQAQNIFLGAEECLKKNPDSLSLQEKCPYIYIFAHPRTADDGVTKRMLWQPRLSKPTAQTNSYLFRAISKTDVIEICWLLPPQEQWAQYQKGNITESNDVLWSINQYTLNRQELEKPHADDYSEEHCRAIFKAFIDEKMQVVKAPKYERI